MRKCSPTPVIARLTVAGILALAGCAGPVNGGITQPTADPYDRHSKEPNASKSAWIRVVFKRTGGFAGVRQRVVVTPSGHWTYTEQGRTDEGSLTPAQSRELQRLARRIGPDDVTGKERDGSVCRDTFQYSLTAGGTTVTWGPCHGRPSHALSEIVRLLVEHTPM